MEKIQKIKELIELMSVEADKVYNKRNRSAATRARKYAQDIKNLLGEFRKDVLEESKK
jgi:hypothetical protein